jgi:Skp family chaperone for outer membrane proteins
MPKSRNRKNHKKKVEAWKNRTQQKVNAANKEIEKIQEKLMDEWKEKQAKEKAKEEINKKSQEDIKSPGIV